jgi:hypothetical protein
MPRAPTGIAGSAGYFNQPQGYASAPPAPQVQQRVSRFDAPPNQQTGYRPPQDRSSQSQIRGQVTLGGRRGRRGGRRGRRRGRRSRPALHRQHRHNHRHRPQRGFQLDREISRPTND